MKHLLPELPFEKDALEPFLTRETIEYHYGKHHQAYVNKLNELIVGTKYVDMELEEILMNSSDGIFNNAAQIWNHTFYWNCLHPKGGKLEKGALYESLQERFGSIESFRNDFFHSALTNFGSGWTWLVIDESNELNIINTSNADTPLVLGLKPLLTIDIWEHAYYVDYRNARSDYIKAFWKYVNWGFIQKNMLSK